eukprot:318549_1
MEPGMKTQIELSTQTEISDNKSPNIDHDAQKQTSETTKTVDGNYTPLGDKSNSIIEPPTQKTILNSIDVSNTQTVRPPLLPLLWLHLTPPSLLLLLGFSFVAPLSSTPHKQCPHPSNCRLFAPSQSQYRFPPVANGRIDSAQRTAIGCHHSGERKNR